MQVLRQSQTTNLSDTLLFSSHFSCLRCSAHDEWQICFRNMFAQYENQSYNENAIEARKCGGVTSSISFFHCCWHLSALLSGILTLNAELLDTKVEGVSGEEDRDGIHSFLTKALFNLSLRSSWASFHNFLNNPKKYLTSHQMPILL